MHPTRLILPAVIAGLLALSSCSGDGDEDVADVATLGDGGATDDDADGDTVGGGIGGGEIDPEFQDAMVDYAECMRDEGIDFPDPQTGEGGIVVIGGPDGGASTGAADIASDTDMEALEQASDACAPILEAVEGAAPRLDPEQEQEMRDQALAFAECMRGEGIDYPDPVFEDNGESTVAIGADFTDDAFQAAGEACGQEGGFAGHAGTPVGGG